MALRPAGCPGSPAGSRTSAGRSVRPSRIAAIFGALRPGPRPRRRAPASAGAGRPRRRARTGSPSWRSSSRSRTGATTTRSSSAGPPPRRTRGCAAAPPSPADASATWKPRSTFRSSFAIRTLRSGAPPPSPPESRGTGGWLPGLVTALSDPDGETAAAAATALGRLGGPEAERALTAVLAGTTGPRAAAALALYRSTDPALVPLLAAALEDGDAETRRSAAWALARVPRPGSEEALRGLLDDADPEIVAWAARGLGLLEDERSRAAAPRARDRGRTGPGDPGPPRPRPPRGQGRRRRPVRVPRRGSRWRERATPARRGRRRAHAPSPVRRRSAGRRSSWRRWPPREAGAGASPSRASPRVTPIGPLLLAFPPGGPAPLDLRLGAAEALPLLPAERLASWLDALLADPATRVRMEASRASRGTPRLRSPRTS